MRFIQIGAFDGRDHISSCVFKFGWDGVLVEPVPHSFEKLRERYRDCNQVSFENVAVAATPGRSVMYWPDPEKGKLMPSYEYTAAAATSSLKREYTALFAHLEHMEIVTGEVEVVTLQHLIDKYQITQLDCLQIDAEGLDGEIVRSIESLTVRPSIVMFEHHYLPDLDDVMALLPRLGYTRHSKYPHDILACVEDAPAWLMGELLYDFDERPFRK